MPKRRLRTRTVSRATYDGKDGNPLDKKIMDNITQFQVCLRNMSLGQLNFYSF